MTKHQKNTRGILANDQTKRFIVNYKIQKQTKEDYIT
jgi:hypothetical protein